MTTNQGTAGQGVGASFTPGPWGYAFAPQDTGFEGDTFLAGPLHCDGTGGFSSVVEGGLVLADDKENEANARLIAAAPELYEALNKLVVLVDGQPLPEPQNGYAYEEAVHEALAALAKVRGQAS